MPGISEETLDEIRLYSDIVDVARRYAEKVKTNREGAMCCCIFHDDKTPSLSLDSDKGLYYCFGCQAGGDVFSFVEEAEHVGFQEAARILARMFGVDVKEKTGQSARKAKKRKKRIAKARKARKSIGRKMHEVLAEGENEKESPAGEALALLGQFLGASSYDEVLRFARVLGAGFVPTKEKAENGEEKAIVVRELFEKGGFEADAFQKTAGKIVFPAYHRRRRGERPGAPVGFAYRDVKKKASERGFAGIVAATPKAGGKQKEDIVFGLAEIASQGAFRGGVGAQADPPRVVKDPLYTIRSVLSVREWRKQRDKGEYAARPEINVMTDGGRIASGNQANVILSQGAADIGLPRTSGDDSEDRRRDLLASVGACLRAGLIPKPEGGLELFFSELPNKEDSISWAAAQPSSLLIRRTFLRKVGRPDLDVAEERDDPTSEESGHQEVGPAKKVEWGRKTSTPQAA